MLKSNKIDELLDKTDDQDPLVITPRPDPDTLRTKGSASIDLRLGTWFLTLRQARMRCLEVDAPVEGKEAQLKKLHFVPFGDQYYLHPRAFVLGVTLEWLRLPANLSGYVLGRSSWGRRGLIIATATLVQPGFKGCLTLEITNVGEIPIAIKPGMTICQLSLHRVDGSGSQSVDRSPHVGHRRPGIGKIRLDDIAKALGHNYGIH